jgi:DNA repair photolyase
MQTVHKLEASTEEITKGTKEWADYNVNCIKGCYNHCRYCYARIMANRFHRSTINTWKDMQIFHAMLKEKFRKKSGRAMFPSTHDIFDFAPFKQACFIVLRNLLASGNDVLVTTKPALSNKEHN